MPPATIHLIALAHNQSISAYVDRVRSKSSVLVVSRCIRWIIRPEKLDVSKLLDTAWDLLIIAPKDSPLSQDLLSKELVLQHYSLEAGVPSSLVKDFKERNERLLHPQDGDVPKLTGNKPLKASSAQGLELDSELEQWAETFELGKGAVSMLNLLAFKPGKEAHESYQKYGQGFAKSAGAKRGGNAKIVGKVISESRWDEIALAQYPSIRHFTEMLASEDYQEINHKYRLPALEDTCILCTSLRPHIEPYMLTFRSELDPVLSQGKAKL